MMAPLHLAVQNLHNEVMKVRLLPTPRHSTGQDQVQWSLPRPDWPTSLPGWMKDSDYNTGFAFDQPIMIDEDSLIFIKEFLCISIF